MQMQPARERAVHRQRRARAARARGGDRQALPLRGLRGPAARPLRRSSWRAPTRRSRERAIPFREGDEVLVTIVEPHMYEVDDAVAKIDGYIVSVAGGGRYVGREAPRADRGGRAAPRPVATLARRPTIDAEREGGDGDDARRIEASAPWPQRRTAPFRCQGGSDPRTENTTMYAIVKTGGKQYRVEQGQTLLVERLPDDEGATRRARAAPLPLRRRRLRRRRPREGQGRRRRSSSTSAARSCASSSSSPSAATSGAPATARS